MGSDPEQYVTERHAAALLGLSVATLSRYRAAGIGPAWARLGGRSVRYRRADVVAWARGQQVPQGA